MALLFSFRTKSNALAVQLDATGKVKYDLIARQGHGKDKIVYSKFTDLLPKEMTNEDDPGNIQLFYEILELTSLIIVGNFFLQFL
jgi:hypothetical protein